MIKKHQVRNSSLMAYPKVAEAIQKALKTKLRPVQSQGRRYLPLTKILKDEWTMDTVINALRPVLRDHGLNLEYRGSQRDFTFYADNSDIYVDILYTEKGELKLDLYVI